ncbi:class I SAM-dependent methyltransferase [Corynebacterium bovis]|uniref:class I SAM-dependent methyltransferase n=1 Tax=Corynebacterium bovis TaxID=36808 RepID=UPI003138EF7C
MSDRRQPGPGTPADLQGRLDRYWSGRATAYTDRQRRDARAASDLRVWTDRWSRVLPGPPGRVLDVGTGSGYLAFLLADLGYDVTGIDMSRGMLAVARDRVREAADGDARAPRFVEDDAVAPARVRGPFDAVVGRYVLWTLRDPVAAVRRWMTLLAPGGTVACADAAWYPGGIDPGTTVESTDGPDAFVRTYSTATLDALPLARARDAGDFAAVLTDAGLADVEVVPVPELAELDRRFGMSPGHESRPQFIVTGRRP